MNWEARRASRGFRHAEMPSRSAFSPFWSSFGSGRQIRDGCLSLVTVPLRLDCYLWPPEVQTAGAERWLSTQSTADRDPSGLFQARSVKRSHATIYLFQPTCLPAVQESSCDLYFNVGYHSMNIRYSPTLLAFKYHQATKRESFPFAAGKAGSVGNG